MISLQLTSIALAGLDKRTDLATVRRLGADACGWRPNVRKAKSDVYFTNVRSPAGRTARRWPAS